MHDPVQKAYRSSQHYYDAVLQQQDIFSQLYVKLFWQGTSDKEIARKLLSWIPDDFRGEILDAPCGTAGFTAEKWQSLTNAHITCLDCSMAMLKHAERRLLSTKHVVCMQADICHLPMNDESMDLVLSMNGFHAFAEKEEAFREINRVLKPGGRFIGCFYIRGCCRITDWLVNHILVRKGWFTPPFLSEDMVREKFGSLYDEIHLEKDGSIVLFTCRKTAPFRKVLL